MNEQSKPTERCLMNYSSWSCACKVISQPASRAPVQWQAARRISASKLLFMQQLKLSQGAQWVQNSAFRKACCALQEAALASGEPVAQLERVRLCSADPDRAEDFFRKILSPCPVCRLGVEALLHPWLKPLTIRMKAELDRKRRHLQLLLHGLCCFPCLIYPHQTQLAGST